MGYSPRGHKELDTTEWLSQETPGSLSLPHEDTASRQPTASQEGVLTRTSLCLDLQPPGLWKLKVCCISYAAYDILLWQPEQTATGISKHHMDSLGLVFQTPQRGPRNTRCSLSRPPNVQPWLGKSRFSNSNLSSAIFACCSQAGYSGTRCFHIQTRKHNYTPMNAIARSTDIHWISTMCWPHRHEGYSAKQNRRNFLFSDSWSSLEGR